LLHIYAPRRGRHDDEDDDAEATIMKWSRFFGLSKIEASNIVSLQPFLHVVQKDPRSQGQTLASFMIMPIQRVPRHVLLLKELQRKSKYNDELSSTIQKAIDR
jgi:hypothetical protein